MNAPTGFSLAPYNTFGVDAFSQRLVSLTDPAELARLEFQSGVDLVLGGGSNVLLVDDIPGTVLLNRIRGIEILEQDHASALVMASGGESWHALVRWTLERGLYGLENLSLIPGLCGAAPMQNIGAYGVELSDVLHSVRAWDWHDARFVDLEREDCQFSYRDSRFKSSEPGRYLITALRLRLELEFSPKTGYGSLQQQLLEWGLSKPSAIEVSEAVMHLRRARLPDPSVLGNAGSFFKNPQVEGLVAQQLRSNFAGLPVSRVSERRFKLSAAWMIQHCGWKGRRLGDAGVSDQHALVLVNYGQASGCEILELAREIHGSVRDTFGIELEAEPVIIGGERL